MDFCSATVVAKSQEICGPILKSKPWVEILAIKCMARPEVVGQILSTSVPTLPREAFAPFVQFSTVAWFPIGFFLQACSKPIAAEISARKATQHHGTLKLSEAFSSCLFRCGCSFETMPNGVPRKLNLAKVTNPYSHLSNSWCSIHCHGDGNAAMVSISSSQHMLMQEKPSSGKTH